MNDDPRIDPTPPVRRFAAHHLALACTVLGAILGYVVAWAFGGH